jgi:predicted Fe-S protein YdhL (DUF1289 family)
MVISPCISICKTDPVTGYCYGCGRRNDKKRNGKILTVEDWKKQNLEEIQTRLKGYQLEGFKESYNHKANKGFFLLKKENLK